MFPFSLKPLGGPHNYTMWMHELQNNSYACKLLKSKQEAS